jgi:AcrR family transcriptional regulator
MVEWDSRELLRDVRMLVGAHGFQGLDVKEVLRRHGISGRKLYAIFESRQGLLASAHWDFLLRLEERLELAAVQVPGPAAFENLWHTWARCEEPVGIFGFFILDANRAELPTLQPQHCFARSPRMTAFIERHQEAGLIRAGDPVLLSAFLWDAFAGLVRASDPSVPIGTQALERVRDLCWVALTKVELKASSPLGVPRWPATVSTGSAEAAEEESALEEAAFA